MQVKNAEQQVLSALQSAKGRGRVLPEEQLQQLNAAIQLLEQDSGVAGAVMSSTATERAPAQPWPGICAFQ